ncbi:MAG: hypothetical protein ABSC76_06750 [Terracidiphilus sp.]|jgi:hypothetical protein
MIEAIQYLLRKEEKWPLVNAVVERTVNNFGAGDGPLLRSVYFTYHAGGSSQYGWLKVDRSSSLFELKKGAQFEIQFDPKRPQRYYCSKALTVTLVSGWATILIGLIYVATIGLRNLLFR